MMRYMFALLLVLTVGMVLAVGPALTQDGPSVCHYNDGTLLNPGRWECPQPLLARAQLNSGADAGHRIGTATGTRAWVAFGDPSDA
jgi:hypothetical protein